MNIKSPDQIKAMREGGKILAAILEELKKMIFPGTSTMELEKKAAQLFNNYKVQPAFKGYHGYPHILCTSINENVVHTFPSKTAILKAGDIINIDCGVIHKQLYTDHAISAIAGESDVETQRFLTTAYKALEAGISQAVAGNYVGDIGYEIQKVVEEAGFGIIKELVGHGVGKTLHEAPQIPNFGNKGNGNKLYKGMTLAIEPIISMGKSGKIKTLDNGWDIVTVDGSKACQVEHTIVIGDKNAEILTLFSCI